MLSRTVGETGAQELAGAAGLDGALRSLRTTAYRHDLRTGAELADAQRAVAMTLLWHLRVLAGWLPRAGAAALRLLAAGFEIANVDDHARALAQPQRPPGPPPYRLGGLATAWPRLSRTGSPAELRAALAGSAWGDPGAESPAAVAIATRVCAAARTAASVPPAARWAAGRLALLVGREVYLAGRALRPPTARRAAHVLGTAAVDAGSFADFRRALPAAARWAVDGIGDPADLWRAETAWWTRLGQDGQELLRGSGLGASPVVGAVAVLSADAWRVRGALELAARGGGSPEVLDAQA
jgi:hypothetical protein